MRRILITGGTGFIGSYLRKKFETQEEFEVIALDCRKGHDRDVELDLTCKEDVLKALRNGAFGQKIDIIVHLASRLISSDHPQDVSVLTDNIKMAENIALLGRELSPEKIIHASTMAVYPNETGTYNEQSTPSTSRNAECLYGLSKICTEQMLDFFMSNLPTKTVHLRFAQVYGEGMRSDRVMSHMEQELRETNFITVYGDGERVSNFISVDQVVEAIFRFAVNEADGIFNVGGEQLSYLQLAQRIIAAKGDSDSSVISVPQGCREQVVLDCSAYQALLKSEEGRL